MFVICRGYKLLNVSTVANNVHNTEIYWELLISNGCVMDCAVIATRIYASKNVFALTEFVGLMVHVDMCFFLLVSKILKQNVIVTTPFRCHGCWQSFLASCPP